MGGARGAGSSWSPTRPPPPAAPTGASLSADVALDVTDGAVRNSDGTLAGSALTLSAAVTNACELGIDPAEALRAVTSTPAALIGRDDVGVLRPGVRADVAVFGDDLVLRETLPGRAAGPG